MGMNTASQSRADRTGERRIADGQVAVVTGGSRGIGFAIAEALLGAGARVVITGRDDAALKSATLELNGRSVGADASEDVVHAIRADVRDAAEAARAVEAAVSRFGGLDILVNNAGVGLFRDVADMSVTEWQRVIDTNLNGVFYCCHTAIPHLRRRGGGWIINISSLAGKNSFAGGAAYCASKAGLNAFSESLMQEVRYDNIRVSYIMPGSVSTGFADRGTAGEAEWKLSPEDVAQVVIDLLTHPARSLPSRVELRPSRPRK
jgi:NAD(P)-dependent dehydrogenase (short-subunit alcohol dehydrogenase family)